MSQPARSAPMPARRLQADIKIERKHKVDRDDLDFESTEKDLSGPSLSELAFWMDIEPCSRLDIESDSLRIICLPGMSVTSEGIIGRLPSSDLQNDVSDRKAESCLRVPSPRQFSHSSSNDDDFYCDPSKSMLALKIQPTTADRANQSHTQG